MLTPAPLPHLGSKSAAAAAVAALHASAGSGTHQSDLGHSDPNQLPVTLPPEARDTIYIDDLPPDVSKRELAHVFRQFPGYEAVRLHVKDSVKHPGRKVRVRSNAF